MTVPAPDSTSESRDTLTSAPLHVVVITGLSGAGRSTALNVLEDLGFFCVDNLPPTLAPGLVDLVSANESAGATGTRSEVRRVALGIDVRTGPLLEGASHVFDELVKRGNDVELWFFDASDEALARRYSETRRPHPLAPDGAVLDGITKERERLGSLRARAGKVIDTTRLTVHELRRMLIEHVAETGARTQMKVRLVSFGFKFGVPVDADLVFDVRFLSNPHFVPELRPFTGLDPRVASFVISSDETQGFLSHIEALLRYTLPRYEREGKAYLTIAIGCTAGRHRSVAIAEELAKRFREVALTDAVQSSTFSVAHRDAAR